MAKQGFWSDPVIEPKRQHKWLLRLDNVPAWVVKVVKKPSFSVSEIEHNYINHKFYYPGRVEWETIDLTLVDPVEPDASATMMNALMASGWLPPEDPQLASHAISKEKATRALGTVRIQQIGNREGDVLEEWTLNNAWITKVDFGELSYDDDGMVEISVSVRYLSLIHI